MTEATPLPGHDRPIGYYIIADDAFALRTLLMKSFSRRGLEKDLRRTSEFLTIACLGPGELWRMLLVFSLSDSDT
ncbi:hypothetical protein DPMN_160197 [Dreissena polymorpha]|uniref:Uncharacterized protein n=1 Tax=Dreissena polymorpha TaxID=45954 RepID=A0A9D4IRE8_DREPO|nr:hypothetical protein DPMN_160197 [Dreissena polymorpha]